MFLYDAIKLLYIFHTLTFFSANTQNIDLNKYRIKQMVSMFSNKTEKEFKFSKNLLQLDSKTLNLGGKQEMCVKK